MTQKRKQLTKIVSSQNSVIKIQVFIILLAFEQILAYSSMGYIDYGPISSTTMTIPIVLGAYYINPLASTFLGLVFGFSSMWRASILSVSEAPADLIFSPFHSGHSFQSVVLAIGMRVLLD